jgi:hypothetical protein
VVATLRTQRRAGASEQLREAVRNAGAPIVLLLQAQIDAAVHSNAKDSERRCRERLNRQRESQLRDSRALASRLQLNLE